MNEYLNENAEDKRVQCEHMFGRPPRLRLGQEYDTTLGVAAEESAEIAQRDLSAHALCIGATDDALALGTALISEVLLQGVPCIVVDVCGTLARMLVQKAAAQEEFSAHIAVRRVTPGIADGEAVDVFGNLGFPVDTSLSWTKQGDLLREHIARISGALLARLGMPGDPQQTREHGLLCAVIESAWRAGQRIEAEDLIRMIQEPPISRIGEFEMDIYIPLDRRVALALAISNFASGTSFREWSTGDRIDVMQLLQPDRAGGGVNPAGRTRATVFDLAHLDTADQRVFTTFLFAQILLWMRLKAGVPHLRCMLYIADADRCDVEPLRMLLRFARAAGFSIVMQSDEATALDRELHGGFGAVFVGHTADPALTTALLAETSPAFNRDAADEWLATLPPRGFLLSFAAARDRAQSPRPMVFQMEM